MSDWRTPIRRLVNKEDHLSTWRRAVLRIIDPAEIYMRRDEPRPSTVRSDGPSGWTGYEHIGGSTPPEQSSPSRAQEEGRDRRYAERRAALQQEFGPYLAKKARSMLPSGSAVVRTTHGTVTARVVKFWHGDKVLEIEQTIRSGDQVGHSLSRVWTDVVRFIPKRSRATWCRVFSRWILTRPR